MASPRVILELPSAVFSVCQNHYQKLVFCWHVFWQMHKLQIHKLVSRCDHLNVSTMYSIFDWKEFEILSYRWPFLQSTKISASEEPNAMKKAPVQFLPLHKLSGKVPVQFMPFRKLSGKCHFLIRFCTSNWSEMSVLCVFFVCAGVYFGTRLMEPKRNRNSVNSGNLVNHLSMNWINL